MNDQQSLLTTKQLADLFGISVATIERWRANNEKNQPPFIRLGGTVRYNPVEVNNWLKTHTITTKGGNREKTT